MGGGLGMKIALLIHNSYLAINMTLAHESQYLS